MSITLTEINGDTITFKGATSCYTQMYFYGDTTLKSISKNIYDRVIEKLFDESQLLGFTENAPDWVATGNVFIGAYIKIALEYSEEYSSYATYYCGIEYMQYQYYNIKCFGIVENSSDIDIPIVNLLENNLSYKCPIPVKIEISDSLEPEKPLWTDTWKNDNGIRPAIYPKAKLEIYDVVRDSYGDIKKASFRFSDIEIYRDAPILSNYIRVDGKRYEGTNVPVEIIDCVIDDITEPVKWSIQDSFRNITGGIRSLDIMHGISSCYLYAVRTDEKGTPDEDGTYVSLEINAILDTYVIDNKFKELNIYYKPSSSDQWILANKYTPKPTDEYFRRDAKLHSTSNSSDLIKIDSRQYSLKLEVVTSWDAKRESYFILPQSFMTMDFKAGGHGMAVGGPAVDDLFECYMDAKFDGTTRFDGDVSLSKALPIASGGTGQNNAPAACNALQARSMVGGTLIPANANLNDYKTFGNYYCHTDANTKTLSNRPQDYAFRMWVECGVGGGNTSYITQTIKRYLDGREWTRATSNGGSSWSSWTQVIVNTDYKWVALQAYPVGALYISYVSTSPASLFGGSWTQITGRYLRADNNVSESSANSHSHGLGAGYAAYESYTLHDEYKYKSLSNTQYWSSNYKVSNHGSGGGVTTANHQTGMALGGTTDGAGVTPPYQNVYVWRRTA